MLWALFWASRTNVSTEGQENIYIFNHIFLKLIFGHNNMAQTKNKM